MKNKYDVLLIAERFRKARVDSGLTQADVARAIDGSPQQVSNWEKGIKAISLKNLLIASSEFNRSLGWLAGENNFESAVRDSVFIADTDLMSPYIECGDSVEVDTTQTDPKEHGIFAIMPGDKVIFRWLRPDDLRNGYTISVTNPCNWESERVENEEELKKLNIIGKAVTVTKKI